MTKYTYMSADRVALLCDTFDELIANLQSTDAYDDVYIRETLDRISELLSEHIEEDQGAGEP